MTGMKISWDLHSIDQNASKIEFARSTILINAAMKFFSFFLLSFHTIIALAKKRGKPVKVFILAGEANVEGYASLSHLHDLVTGQHTLNVTETRLDGPGRYQHLRDGYGQWSTRDDVFVTYEHERHSGWKYGPLDVTHWGAAPNVFGPEVEFGHVMGNAYVEPVILVKAAWGKRSLAKDFRPPSATGETGFQWYRMQTGIANTFAQIANILGEEYKHADIDIGGIVWWHGYTDLWNQANAAEYESNLEHFVRDLRSTLHRPLLPIVIAELGGSGANASRREIRMRDAQQRVANLAEWNYTTSYVRTASFAVPSKPFLDINTHYYGRADTMIAIGSALATEMLRLNHLGPPEFRKSQLESDLSTFGGFLQTFFTTCIAVVAAVLIVLYSLYKNGHISRGKVMRLRNSFHCRKRDNGTVFANGPIRETTMA
jgi:alpha-galactosidase